MLSHAVVSLSSQILSEFQLFQANRHYSSFLDTKSNCFMFLLSIYSVANSVHSLEIMTVLCNIQPSQ